MVDPASGPVEDTGGGTVDPEAVEPGTAEPETDVDPDDGDE